MVCVLRTVEKRLNRNWFEIHFSVAIEHPIDIAPTVDWVALKATESLATATSKLSHSTGGYSMPFSIFAAEMWLITSMISISTPLIPLNIFVKWWCFRHKLSIVSMFIPNWFVVLIFPFSVFFFHLHLSDLLWHILQSHSRSAVPFETRCYYAKYDCVRKIDDEMGRQCQ